jgi:hypothetical protein
MDWDRRNHEPGSLSGVGKCPAIGRQKLLSQCRGLAPIWALRGGVLAVLNSSFQTAKKLLARLATIEAGFYFFTRQIVQLPVEIVRQHRVPAIGAGTGCFAVLMACA